MSLTPTQPLLCLARQSCTSLPAQGPIELRECSGCSPSSPSQVRGTRFCLVVQLELMLPLRGPALPGGGCALVPLGMRGREGQGGKRRLGNAARALWRPPLAGTRGMGARGVYLGTQQCCRQAPHAALLLRNALNLYSILMLPLNPRETTSATVKNEGYSYCCQSLAFGASEVLKTWKRY